MVRCTFPLFILLAALATVQVASQRLLENQRCKSSGGWVCKKIGECPWAYGEIRGGRTPQICNFNGRVPIVCCLVKAQPVTTVGGPQQPPPPTGTTPPRNDIQPGPFKSIEMCKRWSSLVVVTQGSPVAMVNEDEEVTVKYDQCGQVEEPLIVGGESAKGKEYPHMGSVGYKDNPTRWLCGCSLISERYVLTAAHCTDGGTRWGPALYVRLGELDVDSEWDDARPVIMRVSKRINHPGYVSNIGYNDIALMQLERDATFNAYVRPACLPVTWEIPDQTAIATGWGHTTYAGKQSNDLRKVRLKLVSTERCQSVYGSAPKIPQGLKNESMLCAGEEEGKDTCQSDSGGPLQTPLKKPYCMYNIVGVTSFGKACGSAAPSVYTRVSYFVPWIESIVWP